MEKETLDDAAKNKYPIENTGAMFMPNLHEVSNIFRQEGFIAGAKYQAERISLMEIELNHTKTLLESCKKALEDRDKQAERMYSEEIINILDNVRYWETCPDDYKIVIESFLERFKKK